jgi:hypothetical protein
MTVHTPADAVLAERQRVLAEYRRRGEEIESDFYAPWRPSEIFLRAGRLRAAAFLLRQEDALPGPGDPCLEIGYGSLGWLGDLLCWGVREKSLHGLELDPARAEKARASLPAADLRVGDAAQIPWEDGRFRLVVVSTVFTSILDRRVREAIAAEIVRVMAPAGALLWYDFAVNNPGNPSVRRVGRPELRALFPDLAGPVRRVTLAPPIARRVVSRSWALATVLESIPFLRTHLLAVLKKTK